MRLRIRRKRDSGDGTTRENKKRKTGAEMDGLCQPRHERSIGTTKDEVDDRTGGRRTVSAAATPAIKWGRLEDEW